MFGFRLPVMTLINVVFPAPFGPSRPNTSLSRIAKLISGNTRFPVLHHSSLSFQNVLAEEILGNSTDNQTEISTIIRSLRVDKRICQFSFLFYTLIAYLRLWVCFLLHGCTSFLLIVLCIILSSFYSYAIENDWEILRKPHHNIRQNDEKNRWDQWINECFVTEHTTFQGRVGDVLSDNHHEGSRKHCKDQTRIEIRVE